MEKISGILPSSSRVSSVDMKEAAPVRPGTPSFGRPEGVSSLKKAKIGETASAAASLSRERLDWKSKDMQNAAMARDVADRFFKGNNRAAEAVVDIDSPQAIPFAAVESRPSGFKTEELDRLTGSGMFAGKLEAADTDAIDGIADPGLSAASLSAASMSDNASAEALQPEGLYPKGSFINRLA